MIQEIIKFISNINISYVSLILLFLIVSLLFLSKHNTNTILKELFIIIYVTISWIAFYYLNDIFNSIFNLKYLSVKLYLILLIIGNIIMLITINKNINKPYKIINYTMFSLNIIIFIINATIIISNFYSTFIVADLEDAMRLININFIAFIIYLNIMCLTYIILYYLKLVKNKKARKPYSEELHPKIVNTEKETLPNIKEPVINNNYNYIEHNDTFYIDGIDCSIIFEDTSKETALKNYYILLNDINAKLTNGYTLKENIKLKNIINKLNIKDLNNINLDVNQLNKITIDEYNLLKRFLNSRKTSI